MTIVRYYNSATKSGIVTDTKQSNYLPISKVI